MMRAGAMPTGGKLIRFGGPDRETREELARFEYLARQWHDRGRSRRMLLPARLVRRGGEAVAAGRRLDVAPSPRLVALLDASARASRWRRGLAAGGAVLVVAAVPWWLTTREAGPALAVDEAPAGGGLPTIETPVEEPVPSPSRPVFAEWVEHRVIPVETLRDVAERYGVSPGLVAKWNGIDPEAPLAPGGTLRIKPNARPLPQQQVEYEVERGDTWRSLSERFGVSLSKLRAYNPDGGKTLRTGQQLVVWLDPKPHPPPSERKPIPDFSPRADALSHGSPNGGWLENGLQLPQSSLYRRRKPNLMFGSSHTIRHLMRGIALFRRDMFFDGVVVVMDISRRKGGSFPPHKSHQAGRDVDVWLPTLKGVYKQNHLGKDRKPQPNEVDWYATWGLVKGLVDTGEIKFIFIEYDLMAKIYHAAALSGVPESTLHEVIQWPRPKFAMGGILRHSDSHTRHIHVRFRCGPRDKDCRD
ncbi:MAG: LysM peptidoglycan-binding domain-containing protein [Myxococcales bacterium FL481]|nr:MAG: LysM peptidoglycan-binding domain-containing protein [Myxococcales bacterium FL481]